MTHRSKELPGDWEEWAEDSFKAFFKACWSVYIGRSIKSGFWRFWGTLTAHKAQEAKGYSGQCFVGVLQALANQGLVEVVSVVLWRAPVAPTEQVPTNPTKQQQEDLELFFGAGAFRVGGPRTENRPAGSDRLLNYAPLGAWQGHGRSGKSQLTEEQLEKKKEQQLLRKRKYEDSAEGKKVRADYRASDHGKEKAAEWRASERGVKSTRKYEDSAEGKKFRADYQASDHGKEKAGEWRASDHGKEKIAEWRASDHAQGLKQAAKRRKKEQRQVINRYCTGAPKVLVWTCKKAYCGFEDNLVGCSECDACEQAR
jgi:hypothetical protein